MLIKFLAAWLVFSLILSLLVPYPTWIWAGALMAAIFAVVTN